ncbi:chlorophyll synthesis pathway protein BchC [Verruconis gallopava]|uniref:D-xylulose reductase n=1 Tax=Verruconis gallopava TaxID=253628 RepID=A0A0D2AQ39_9PEZI|nr:chlorophyll synthesis pathway protein BchC [Verruconis gallopava]KIW08615.1 chlorophyll synthesis pathway protein BchC [Verruconis gallopava]
MGVQGQNPSFVLQKQDEFKFEDRPVPTLDDDPHDVLIEVKYTGICGSDVHYWTHGRIGSYVVEGPMTLGHESAGIVHSVGSHVKTLKPGDHVAMEPGVPCRRCVRCKSGFYNLCPDMRFAATPPIDGTLTRYYKLPEDFCYKLPHGMTLQEGALMEPTAVAVHVCKQAEVKLKDTLVVFGAGPVGLLSCAVGKAFGASKVICVDINEERLKFAKEYAATGVYQSQRIPAEENARNIIDQFGLGEGADCVIDATGAEPCIQTCVHVLRKGGTYCQAGMGPSDITFPIGALCGKELTVRGSFRYKSGDYAVALDLVSSGKLNVKPLISKTVAFEEAEQAFHDVKAARGIKILIEGPVVP